MLAVAENMPETSEYVPLISIYLTLVMAMTSVSVIFTVFVLNLHHRGPNRKRVPYWLRKLIVKDFTKRNVKNLKRALSSQDMSTSRAEAEANTEKLRKNSMPKWLNRVFQHAFVSPEPKPVANHIGHSANPEQAFKANHSVDSNFTPKMEIADETLGNRDMTNLAVTLNMVNETKPLTQRPTTLEPLESKSKSRKKVSPYNKPSPGLIIREKGRDKTNKDKSYNIEIEHEWSKPNDTEGNSSEPNKFPLHVVESSNDPSSHRLENMILFKEKEEDVTKTSSKNHMYNSMVREHSAEFHNQDLYIHESSCPETKLLRRRNETSEAQHRPYCNCNVERRNYEPSLLTLAPILINSSSKCNYVHQDDFLSSKLCYNHCSAHKKSPKEASNFDNCYLSDGSRAKKTDSDNLSEIYDNFTKSEYDQIIYNRSMGYDQDNTDYDYAEHEESIPDGFYSDRGKNTRNFTRNRYYNQLPTRGSSKKRHSKRSNSSDILYTIFNDALVDSFKRNHLEDVERRIIYEWRIVAAFVDKVLFWIFLVLTLALTLTCLVFLPSSNKLRDN